MKKEQDISKVDEFIINQCIKAMCEPNLDETTTRFGFNYEDYVEQKNTNKQ